MVSRDGLLYVLGGHGNTTFLDDILVWDEVAWFTLPQRLTFATDFAGVAELGKRVVRTCGSDCNTAEISTDLTNWTRVTSLPDATRDGGALVGFHGRVIVSGGGPQILSTLDGTVWSPLGSLPQPVIHTSAVQYTPQ